MIKFIYLKNSFDRLCQVVIERNCRGEKKSLASPISFVLASSAKLRKKEDRPGMIFLTFPWSVFNSSELLAKGFVKLKILAFRK